MVLVKLLCQGSGTEKWWDPMYLKGQKLQCHYTEGGGSDVQWKSEIWNWTEIIL